MVCDAVTNAPVTGIVGVTNAPPVFEDTCINLIPEWRCSHPTQRKRDLRDHDGYLTARSTIFPSRPAVRRF